MFSLSTKHVETFNNQQLKLLNKLTNALEQAPKFKSQLRLLKYIDLKSNARTLNRGIVIISKNWKSL